MSSAKYAKTTKTAVKRERSDDKPEQEAKETSEKQPYKVYKQRIMSVAGPQITRRGLTFDQAEQAVQRRARDFEGLTEYEISLFLESLNDQTWLNFQEAFRQTETEKQTLKTRATVMERKQQAEADKIVAAEMAAYAPIRLAFDRALTNLRRDTRRYPIEQSILDLLADDRLFIVRPSNGGQFAHSPNEFTPTRVIAAVIQQFSRQSMMTQTKGVREWSSISDKGPDMTVVSKILENLQSVRAILTPNPEIPAVLPDIQFERWPSGVQFQPDNTEELYDWIGTASDPNRPQVMNFRLTRQAWQRVSKVYSLYDLQLSQASASSQAVFGSAERRRKPHASSIQQHQPILRRSQRKHMIR